MTSRGVARRVVIVALLACVGGLALGATEAPVPVPALEACQLRTAALEESLIDWQVRALVAEATLALKVQGPDQKAAVARRRQEIEAALRAALQISPKAVLDPAGTSFVTPKE